MTVSEKLETLKFCIEVGKRSIERNKENEENLNQMREYIKTIEQTYNLNKDEIVNMVVNNTASDNKKLKVITKNVVEGILVGKSNSEVIKHMNNGTENEVY
ncbi:hypothetical protein [Mammaliicoccus sp. E-M24]|uniref:hypothetical protein n=1 Tax=Mammaliicoccus sp. E-M24 TaxID=2898684 RepID=UPI001EFB63AA|nr:hypothetical protein [Mammaliicoccus sp. E-M24]